MLIDEVCDFWGCSEMTARRIIKRYNVPRSVRPNTWGKIEYDDNTIKVIKAEKHIFSKCGNYVRTKQWKEKRSREQREWWAKLEPEKRKEIGKKRMVSMLQTLRERYQ